MFTDVIADQFIQCSVLIIDTSLMLGAEVQSKARYRLIGTRHRSGFIVHSICLLYQATQPSVARNN